MANTNAGPPTCPIPRWQLLKQQLNNVDPEEFDRLRAAAPTGSVIDVRTEEEFAAFHLEGAVNYNYLGPNFLEQMEALDPNREYLVYCRSGRRSVRACTLMRNAGITQLVHLDGGINAYQTT
ncbi:MAG: rhodanese-like domain-containing protein [Bacteroidota bacterium]